jgi:C-3',4' desaturase CrtD
MTYEVVVVGGGIGGLTTAALLAARGLNVCLLERASQPGGCVAPFEKFGYSFDGSMGLYALWDRGEIHDRIFSELPVLAPEVRKLEPAYVVRLPDGTAIALTTDSELFHESLRTSFPECAAEALAFYRDAEFIGDALLRAGARVPDLLTAGSLRRHNAFWPSVTVAGRIRRLGSHTTRQHLSGTSTRFVRFIDAQLQQFAQCGVDECAYLYACVILALRHRGFFEMRGGAGALANKLVESIKQSGGKVRLDTPALRLAYDSSGRAVGVDLLSGETVTASRAIISNLTVWDTYGKLVGLDRTPTEIRKRMNSLKGRGAYLVYLGMDDAAADKLPANHIIAVTDSPSDDSIAYQLMLALSPGWDPRGPTGKRAATVHTFTDTDEWFTFHQDESEHEEQDQATLELVWQRLQRSIPEVGDTVEVIETVTPRDYYEMTRRKLGMVGGSGNSLDVFGSKSISHRTALPNLFLVGDTTFPGAGLAAVSQSALIVANEISSR